MLIFLELHSGDWSEYITDIFEEGEEPDSGLLPTSSLHGSQQRNGKRKMLLDFETYCHSNTKMLLHVIVMGSFM